MKVVITEPARDDLRNIYQYIVLNFYSEKYAEKTANELLDLIFRLSEFPELGLNADEKFGRKFVAELDMRLLISDKHLIWYAIFPAIDGIDKVQVLRISNQSQEIAALIFKKD